MTAKLFLVAISLSLLVVAGCNKKSGSTVQNSNKVRVGYIGLTCRSSDLRSLRKGVLQGRGTRARTGEVQLVNLQGCTGAWQLRHHSSSGDVLFEADRSQGLDVRFLAGIHRGCLRVQAGVKTNIHTIEDLKGKRIGVPGMGTPPFVFANRVFGVHGIDAGKDITWKVYPAGELGLAIDKGEVDAVANAEPIGSLLIAEGKVRNIADQIMDAPYKDEYCCEVIANGKWVDANPDTAARATRALLKGAKWVETNPRAAAIMAVEKKYLASTPELNTVALARLRYIPSVHLAEESVQSAGREMKVAKMLSPETDTEALAKRAFMHLPA